MFRLKSCFSQFRLYSTIFALSTSIKDTGSALAVIRVSGSCANLVIKNMVKAKPNRWFDKPKQAIVTQIINPKTSEFIDKGIVIWFPKPNSYTGEDLCELHVHGSMAVISAILKALGQVNELRPAEPGEFTKRAFLNGKIDLIEAEGISHLIQAKTESQRKRALNAIQGNISDIYGDWRQQMIRSIAHLEANIDFGEDELIDEQVIDNVKSNLTHLSNQIKNHLTNSAKKSDLIKEGIQICIIGQPNVGKSTFINLLSERELSIVSPISGTTRDIVETWLNIDGYAIRICDTAGLKDLNQHLHDVIEHEGIKRAINRAKQSDIILLVIDATKLLNYKDNLELLLPSHIQDLIKTNKVLFIINKIDLLTKENLDHLCKYYSSNDICLISCKNKEGIESFMNKFSDVIKNLCGDEIDEQTFITERHQTHLSKVCDLINLSLSQCDNDLAISAHHLKRAAEHISQITGKITTEDILDVIFRDFCIGK